MNLQKLTSTFWAIFAVIAMSLFSISCSDTETTDSTGFAIYYTGMTDIGPSMVGTISSPTYKGAAPSDFAITGITLNGEAYTGGCFEIDPETGKISISDTKNAQTGRYSISISCVAGGKSYHFPNIVTVKMLAAAPEGIKMTPAQLTADYGDVIDINSIADMPTSQISTEGEHISVTGYKVGPVALVTMNGEEKEYQPLSEEYKNCFSITPQGVFSIIQGSEEAALLEPGVYSVSILVNTKVAETILEKAVEVKITSKPLELVYSKNEGMIEEMTGNEPTEFNTCVVPTFKGSTDGLEFAIYSVTPATDKIKINEKTGQIYVEPGHGFKEGDVFEISVLARNAYNTPEEEGTVFENVFTLKTVGFINPISDFYYGKKTNNNIISRTELARFEITPKINGDEVLYKFELPEELKNVGLTFDENNGSITAIKGHKAPLGDHKLKVTATNPKGSTTIEVTLTIRANPNKFTYIHYGNNLDEGGAEREGVEYQNQFRFYKQGDMGEIKAPKTDFKGKNTDLKWKFTKIHQTGIKENGEDGSFTVNGWKNNQVGIILVEATAGDDPDTQVTVTTPVFFHCCSEVDGYTVEYSPMVLHVNPKTGGASAVPVIKKKGVALTNEQRAEFWMDYRRAFNYYNNGGVRSNGVAHENGQPSGSVVSDFMVELWNKCNGGKGSKQPMSYFATGKGGELIKAKDEWSTTLGYVDNGSDLNKRLSVNVVPNQWNVDGWANGFMVGQMTFLENKRPTNDQLNTGKEIFPFIIWFDENYEK